MTGQFSFLFCLRKCGKEFFEILNWLIMIQTDPVLHEDELSSAAKFFEEKKEENTYTWAILMIKHAMFPWIWLRLFLGSLWE